MLTFRTSHVTALGLALALAAAAGAGCGRHEGQALVIATTWTEARRQGFEAGFQQWRQANLSGPASSVPIHWIAVGTSDELMTLISRNPRIDAVLAGSADLFQRLAQTGRLEALERPGQPRWLVTGTEGAGTVAFVGMPAALDGDLTGPMLRGRVAFDDPRVAADSLARMKQQLARGPWADQYASLVREASNARPVGWRAGSAMASLDRVSAGTVATQETDRLEGVALLRGAPHPQAGKALVTFLSSTGAGEPPVPPAASDDRADALLADLLGATLVDAQPELVEARVALTHFEPAARAEREAFLVQPPPWPPASVAQMEQADEGAALLGTLAEQLVPDAEARAWLLASWKAEPGAVDGSLLAKLAAAARGRLADEPRFRAWLRAEWTAWARQRYRAAHAPRAEVAAS